MRARDFGLVCGTLPTGPRNTIADVAGVRVGHCTLDGEGVRTGVTAILPHDGDLYREKLLAASTVINGFGKSCGLVQVDELGTLETPILLTNTFGVPACAEALVRAAIAANPGIGRSGPTVNPVVCECNDGALSDIQALAVRPVHAETALAAASVDFAQGSIGAGTGMSCFGFKGGIGSASRRLVLGDETFTFGALVLANFGRAGDLVLPDGRRPKPADLEVGGETPERGSVIVILACDVPLAHRQLARIVRRAGAGLARLGSVWGHGSGDIAVGFSTAARFPADSEAAFHPVRMLNEAHIDPLFQAAAETTQEAVLEALCHSPATTARDGSPRPSLADWLAA